jgi:murein DD-endopeptidase MepM/ murein hydrolase activator NlpD
MPVGDELINASPYIKDKAGFTAGINKISDELGVSRDFLPIIMMTEANLNPAAYGGSKCGGLIQFCGGNAGAREVGSTPEAIAAMSEMEQLPLIRQYLSSKGIPKGADLPTVYLSILYPVAMDEANSTNLTYIPEQARHLYGPNGVLSKDTITAGLLSHAGIDKGKLTGASPSGDKGFTTLDKAGSKSSTSSGGGAPASLGTNNNSVIIGTYTRDCTKTAPWDWTMQMGKIYRGCTLQVTTLGIEGGQSTTPMYGSMSTKTTVATVTGGSKPSMGGNTTPPKAGSLNNPVKGFPLTSPRGWRWGRMHQGVDFGTPTGTPIYAPADGVIGGTGVEGGYGNWLSVKHPGSSIGETFYAHMDRYAGLADGTPVKAGQLIGYTGSTGRGTGPHLHMEVYDNNNQRIDPCSVMEC